MSEPRKKWSAFTWLGLFAWLAVILVCINSVDAIIKRNAGQDYTNIYDGNERVCTAFKSANMIAIDCNWNRDNKK